MIVNKKRLIASVWLTLAIGMCWAAALTAPTPLSSTLLIISTEALTIALFLNVNPNLNLKLDLN